MTLRCSFRDLSELNRTLKQKEYFLINNKYCIFAIGALEFLKKKKKKKHSSDQSDRDVFSQRSNRTDFLKKMVFNM